MQIPFNKPFLTGKETKYIEEAVASGMISGNGTFTKKCQAFFESTFGFRKTLLTTSCTDALEMAAILSEVGPDDEVIVPSYTFVSSANPFILRGATVVFADSKSSEPNVSVDSIRACITDRTKVIVVVHYAGVAVDMDALNEAVADKKILIIEDAAQAIDSTYKGKPLGSLGHLAAFSFHETKNIISGEGGLLVINDERFVNRAEIIWEKGTDRAAFWRGEVDKYGWVDIGSSFLPSEVTAAFLYAQLENIEEIQSRRKVLWERYHQGLKELEEKGRIKLPYLPEYASNNGHMFYIVVHDLDTRTALISHLKSEGIYAVFHYLSLHKSTFIQNIYPDYHPDLPQADRYTDCLIRLPLYYELDRESQEHVIHSVESFFKD
ncbi:MAG: dTDP-4-amino-4,6-dideoxygalactose transaminase [Flavobacteriales bacterium]|nr:dTDP-4-amino-4,6-dideoxygalactose transaminase [Flavobacteriales bacterium]